MEQKEGTVKVLQFVKEDGAYGFVELEIPQAILKKHGKEIAKSNPDLFYIFVSSLERKAREMFDV